MKIIGNFKAQKKNQFAILDTLYFSILHCSYQVDTGET